MDNQLMQIARRIKSLREKNDMEIEWAARALGITTDELEAYESGEADIPVGFLYMAAKKYGVELSTLLTGENPHEQKYSLVRKGEGINVDRRSHYDYQSLCADFANKKMEPLLVTVEPEESDPSFNTHPGQEFHYILQGTLEVCIGDEALILDEGDALMFHSENPHTLKALNNKPVQVLVVIL